MTKTKAFLIGVIGAIIIINLFFSTLALFNLYNYFKFSVQFNIILLFLIPMPFISLYLFIFKRSEMNLKTLLMSWLGGVVGTPTAFFISLTIGMIMSGGK